MFSVVYFFEAKVITLFLYILSSEFFDIDNFDNTLFCFLIFILTQRVVLITTF